MKATCTTCGVEFDRPAAWLRKVKNPMCSRRCNGKERAKALRPYCGNMKGRKRTDPPRMGADNPAWKGGRYIEPDKGYVMVRMPDHPRARANGYVLEHILVAEAMLGRPLAEGEEVHHINKNRADNRPENLKVYASHLEHWMVEHYTDVASARDAANSKRSTRGLAHL